MDGGYSHMYPGIGGAKLVHSASWGKFFRGVWESMKGNILKFRTSENARNALFLSI